MKVLCAGSLDKIVDSLAFVLTLVKVAFVPLIMWLPFKRMSIYIRSTFKFQVLVLITLCIKIVHKASDY